MPSLIGQTLLDQFRVDSFIAAGGMGSVYRVWDLKRSVFLAMKVLHTDPTEDPVLFRRFQREANDLMELAHPNIVPFYGLYQSESSAFLLERYIEGPTLKDLLQRQGGQPLPLPEALAYLRALCSALGYAHVNHVVHCDVKPGNVMVDRGGNVFLTDFGIARHTDTVTTTFGTAGTPFYMAPEQIRGEKPSPAADIYALGVILFEMLTGRRPFRGDELPADQAGSTASQRILQAHLRLPPPDPLQLNPSLPPALAKVILCCLEKDLQLRFRTTEDLYQAALRASSLAEEALSEKVSQQTLLAAPPVSVLPAALPGAAGSGVKSPGKTIPAASPAGSYSLTRRLAPPWPRAGIVLLLCLAGLAALGLLYLLGRGGPTQAPGVDSLAGRLTATLHAVLSNTPLPPASHNPAQVPSGGTAASASPTLPPTVKVTATPTPSSPPEAPRGRIVWTCQINRNDKNEQLCLMDVGRPKDWRQITFGAGNHKYASLAPDGKSVVYAWTEANLYQVFEIDLASGDERRLTFDFVQADGPEISPLDGKWIVFSGQKAGDSNLGIWVMDRNGENARKLFYKPGNDAKDPTWSPDGSQILFAYGPADNRLLYIMNEDGSGVHPVSQDFLTRGRSDWSSDGLHIVGYTGGAWERTLYLMRADGSDLHQVGDILNSQGPSFSPDGLWITFTGYMIKRDDNSCEIFIMRLDGSDLQQLTDNETCDYQPRWGR